MVGWTVHDVLEELDCCHFDLLVISVLFVFATNHQTSPLLSSKSADASTSQELLDEVNGRCNHSRSLACVDMF